MERQLLIKDWIIVEERKKLIKRKETSLEINNVTNNQIELNYKTIIQVPKGNIKNLYIHFEGEVKNSGGYLVINQKHTVPINSEVLMPVNPTEKLEISLIVAANSCIEIKDIIIKYEERKSLIDTLDKQKEVLIIVPNYPDYVNLYNCAFAHSRNKEYIKNGINAQVFAVNEKIWYQTKYERDNVPIIKGTYRRFETIINHTPI